MTHRDYLAANLAHEAGCPYHVGLRPFGMHDPSAPCNCPVADILAAWDAMYCALEIHADPGGSPLAVHALAKVDTP